MKHRSRSPRATLAVALALVAGVAACAHDVAVQFPAEVGAEVGAIELAFTNPASGVSVAVDGVMLVRGARTERITIAAVPTGFRDVAIAAGPGEKQVRVWVERDRVTAVPLGATDDAPLSTVRGMALSLLSLAVYTLLR